MARTNQNKPSRALRSTLEQRINAIIDRASGLPYPEVLETHRLTPNQFDIAVNRDLAELALSATGKAKHVLEGILADDERRMELFRMGEEFLQKQYLQVVAERSARGRGKFCHGTLLHPANVELLIYYALTFHNPKLASLNRTEVVHGIRTLPQCLSPYFARIGIGGVMMHALENSPLSVLQAFDRVYQRKTGDVSMFDLSQPEHMHEWSDFKASQAYWQDPLRAEKAVYHTLSENNPLLKSTNRAEVIQGLKVLPRNLGAYFTTLGLSGLQSRKHQTSEFAILKAFDRTYQRITGDASLFDQTQQLCLRVNFEDGKVTLRTNRPR